MNAIVSLVFFVYGLSITHRTSKLLTESKILLISPRPLTPPS